MSTKKKDFNVSGPSQLTAVNWENPDHCTVVTASLVRGVYILNDQKNKALAPHWWESFDFTLVKALHDKKDDTIYGALFRKNTVAVRSPEFVIAFRGTQIEESSWFQDLRLDYNILLNKLQERGRVKQAFNSVRDHLITSPAAANTWLAGHSLGAAIALLVGKKLAKDNCRLETYLFNPPIAAFPRSRFIKNEKLRMIFYADRIVDQAIIASNKIVRDKFISKVFVGPLKFFSKGCVEYVDPSKAISEWVPHLYVNPADPICSEYIGYFDCSDSMRKLGMVENRVLNRSYGHAVLEIFAAKCSQYIQNYRLQILQKLQYYSCNCSCRQQFKFLAEKIANWTSSHSLLEGSEPMHVLASAELNINKDKSKCHSLEQWYDVDLCCETKVYR